jgi:hypothetical protein
MKIDKYLLIQRKTRLQEWQNDNGWEFNKRIGLNKW